MTKEMKLKAELRHEAGNNVAATIYEGNVLQGTARGEFRTILAYLRSIGVTEMRYATNGDERKILGLKS